MSIKNEVLLKIINIKQNTCPDYDIDDAETEYNNFIKKIKNHKLVQFNKQLLEISRDENGIPKIIHLTCKNKQYIEGVYKNCLQKIKHMYTDYKILIYDNNDIYDIVNFFDEKNLDSIGNINIGAVLADIFRYLILYLRGGYYMDLDCEPIKHIKHLSSINYHGNNENYFKIVKNSKIKDSTCEFLEQICENCDIINKYGYFDLYKCKGHQFIKKHTNIILGYEFNNYWHKNTEFLTNKWSHNEIGVSQWFMACKPYQPFFLYCYKKSLKRATKYLNDINTNDENYHFKVINSTGPLFFTKMIDEFSKKDPIFNNNITILPADYFCYGSGNTVPYTKNCFIKHQYAGSWLK
jgi:mannosyltransferase OCH1-like enzyme